MIFGDSAYAELGYADTGTEGLPTTQQLLGPKVIFEVFDPPPEFEVLDPPPVFEVYR